MLQGGQMPYMNHANFKTIRVCMANANGYANYFNTMKRFFFSLFMVLLSAGQACGQSYASLWKEARRAMAGDLPETALKALLDALDNL